MNLEAVVLDALKVRPASGGKLIERFQAEGAVALRGQAVLVYGALANLRARGALDLLAEGPGERVWGLRGVEARAAKVGFPPSFGLGAGELALVDRELHALTKGLDGPYFEELRRAVVADADRRVFHGEKLPRAVALALEDLGPAGSVRPFLLRVERGGPVELSLRPVVRRRWLLVPLALIALVFLVRLFVVGVYTVPPESISMAPALIPAVEGGDRLVVANLLAYQWEAPRRGDLAILEQGDKILVKRVMGLPGETVSVQEGDLFVNGKRFVKERPLLDRVKVPLLGLAAYRRGEAPGGWSTERKLRETFLLPDGTEEDPAAPEAREAVVLARVRAGTPMALIQFHLQDGGKEGQIVLLEAAGLGSVSVGGIEATRGDALRLPRDREVEIWFTNADRLFRVEIDGREVARVPLARRPGFARIAIYGRGVELTRLEIARDLAYSAVARARPARLGEERYFVLGDNSPRSLDSRKFGPIRRDQLLGRVFAVVWPLARARSIR